MTEELVEQTGANRLMKGTEKKGAVCLLHRWELEWFACGKEHVSILGR